MITEHGKVIFIVVELHDATQIVGITKQLKVLLQHLASHILIAANKTETSVREFLLVHIGYDS